MKKNFAISEVVTAPSPTTSGTTLVVSSGHGSRFAVNETAFIAPAGQSPDPTTSEVVLITNISTDTLTITRAQESSSARDIQVGDAIYQGISGDDWNKLRSLLTENSDGFQIQGGTTERQLTLSGADIVLVGSGSNTYTFPASTGQLMSRDSIDTVTGKHIDGDDNEILLEDVSSKIYLSTQMDNLTDATNTLMELDTSVYNNGCTQTLTAGNYKIAVPTDGMYMISAQVTGIGTTSSDKLEIQIAINGSVKHNTAQMWSGSSNYKFVPMTVIERLSANDYIQVYGRVDGSSTVDIRASAQFTYLEVVRLYEF